MKKFIFSMTSVLNVKATLKDLRAAELAEARAKLRKEQERLDGLNAEIKRAMEIPSGETQNLISYLMLRERYLKRLKDMRKKQIMAVEREKKNVEIKINALRDAMIELKKMERAKEKEKEAWHLEFLREEQKINDETGSVRAFYKSASA
jgi:flagellar export protein FliJ